ncbi:putative retrotransposon gag domain-containing protein [Helianthus annuus]|nr:putative retrotransposon gag domain-containing protein [Helianthus annuus]
MANNRQTVHQQATQNFTGLASPITVPPIVNENSWQIPSYAMQAITNTIQFHGRDDEDAPTHINRFSRMLATFSLHGAPNDATYLQLFPFSIAGRAATWLDSQPTGTFTTWAGLGQAFLNKYFPPAKASRLRDQIHSFRMEPDEPYYLAWERFQNLCARCSQHGLSDWALCEKFYNGLTQETRDRFDTNGGHMMGILTVAECLERFEAFAQSQSRADQRYQSGNSNTITRAPTRGVNHVTMDPSLAAVLENMTRELKEIKAKVDKCEFCRGGHDTSACPLLVGEEQVDFVGGGLGGGQPSGFGSNFNSGWRNNNNNINNIFRSNGPPGFQIAQNPNRGLGSLFGGGSNGQFNKGFNGQVKDGGSSSQVQTSQDSSYDLGGSLERMEAMMSQLVVRDQTTQKKLSEHDLMLKNHQVALQDLQRVVGDMSRKLEERLPGQFAGNTQPNPNAHVKAITTRSGKTVGDPSIEERVVDKDGDIVDEEIEMEAPGEVQKRLGPASTAQPGESQVEKEVEKTSVDVRPSPLVDHSRVPFPSRLRNQKYSREYRQFLDIFKQLKINLPFIEALQSMPKYAKFLKDLLRNKEKLGELSNVPLNGGCLAVVSNQLPEKLTFHYSLSFR